MVPDDIFSTSKKSPPAGTAGAPDRTVLSSLKPPMPLSQYHQTSTAPHAAQSSSPQAHSSARAAPSCTADCTLPHQTLLFQTAAMPSSHLPGKSQHHFPDDCTAHSAVPSRHCTPEFPARKNALRLSSPSAESAQFPIPCRNPSPAPRASPSRRMPAAPRQCHSRKGMDSVSSSNRSADHRAAHPASKILLFYPMKIPPPADRPAPHHTKRSVSFTRRLLFSKCIPNQSYSGCFASSEEACSPELFLSFFFSLPFSFLCFGLNLSSSTGYSRISFSSFTSTSTFTS